MSKLEELKKRAALENGDDYLTDKRKEQWANEETAFRITGIARGESQYGPTWELAVRTVADDEPWKLTFSDKIATRSALFRVMQNELPEGACVLVGTTTSRGFVYYEIGDAEGRC